MEDKILQKMKENHIRTEMYYFFTDEYKESMDKIELQRGYIVNLLKTKYGLINIPLDFIDKEQALKELPADCPYYDLIEQLGNLAEEEVTLAENCKKKYIAGFEGRTADILKDIKTNLSYESHKSVLIYIDKFKNSKLLELLEKHNIPVPCIEENFISYYSFLRSNLEVQFEAFTYWGIDEENPLYIEAIKCIEDKVISFGFPKPAEVITKEEVEEEQAKLAPIIKPNTYSILNNKIVNRYTSIEDNILSQTNDGQLSLIIQSDIKAEIEVSSRKNKLVTTLVSIAYNGELPPALARLKAFDKAVLNAIVSLIQAGNNQFTLEDISRTLSGNDTKQKITDKKKERLLTSVKKLGATRIWIDLTDELNNHYFSEDDIDERLTKGIVDEALFNYRGVTLENNKGNEVYVIQVLSTPILMAYSKAKKQLVSFPAYLLNTKSVSSTDEIIVIREYLAKQIMLMKNGHRDNKDTILLETMFNECNLEEKDRVSKKRLLDNIDNMLTEWETSKDMKGFIKGHEFIAEGKAHSITKIIINY